MEGPEIPAPSPHRSPPPFLSGVWVLDGRRRLAAPLRAAGGHGARDLRGAQGGPDAQPPLHHGLPPRDPPPPSRGPLLQLPPARGRGRGKGPRCVWTTGDRVAGETAAVTPGRPHGFACYSVWPSDGAGLSPPPSPLGPFLGAGFSFPARLPGWAALLVAQPPLAYLREERGEGEGGGATCSDPSSAPDREIPHTGTCETSLPFFRSFGTPIFVVLRPICAAVPLHVRSQSGGGPR